MPLLNNVPFVKAAPPAKLRADEEVFYCSMTHEIFRDYESFYKRVILCNSLVWTCSFTGKHGLTYEEAIDSEKRSILLGLSLAEHLKRLALFLVVTAVQRQRIESVVDDLFSFIEPRCFVGDRVVALAPNGREFEGTVVELRPDAAAANAGGVVYTVEFDARQFGAPASNLIRQQCSAQCVRRRPPVQRHVLAYFVQYACVFSRAFGKVVVKSHAVDMCALRDATWQQFTSSASPPPTFERDPLRIEPESPPRSADERDSAAQRDSAESGDDDGASGAHSDGEPRKRKARRGGRAAKRRARDADDSAHRDGESTKPKGGKRRVKNETETGEKRKRKGGNAASRRRSKRGADGEIDPAAFYGTAQIDANGSPQAIASAALQQIEMRRSLEDAERRREAELRREQERDERRRRREEEREQRLREKRERDELVRSWNTAREDLLCEDLRPLPDLPAISERQTRFAAANAPDAPLFADVLMVVEFVARFAKFLQLDTDLPEVCSLSASQLEEALLDDGSSLFESDSSNKKLQSSDSDAKPASGATLLFRLFAALLNAIFRMQLTDNERDAENYVWNWDVITSAGTKRTWPVRSNRGAYEFAVFDDVRQAVATLSGNAPRTTTPAPIVQTNGESDTKPDKPVTEVKVETVAEDKTETAAKDKTETAKDKTETAKDKAETAAKDKIETGAEQKAETCTKSEPPDVEAPVPAQANAEPEAEAEADASAPEATSRDQEQSRSATTRSQADEDELASERDRELLKTSTFAAHLPLRIFGESLHTIKLDSSTLTEALRLHVLSSGARATELNAKFRFQRRGGHTFTDDAGFAFLRSDCALVRALETRTVYELPATDKLKLLSLLVHQLMTFVGVKEQTETNAEEHRWIRSELRQRQAADYRRQRDEATFQRNMEARYGAVSAAELDASSVQSERVDAAEREYTEAYRRDTEPKLPTAVDRHEAFSIALYNFFWDDSNFAQLELTRNERIFLERKRIEMSARMKEIFRLKTADLVRALVRLESKQTGAILLGIDRLHRRYYLFQHAFSGLLIENPFSICDAHAETDAQLCDAIETTLAEVRLDATQKRIETLKAMNAAANPSESSSTSAEPGTGNMEQSFVQPDGTWRDPRAANEIVSDLLNALGQARAFFDADTYRLVPRWHFVSTASELDKLIAALNPRGHRESALRQQLVDFRDIILLEQIRKIPPEWLVSTPPPPPAGANTSASANTSGSAATSTKRAMPASLTQLNAGGMHIEMDDDELERPKLEINDSDLLLSTAPALDDLDKPKSDSTGQSRTESKNDLEKRGDADTASIAAISTEPASSSTVQRSMETRLRTAILDFEERLHTTRLGRLRVTSRDAWRAAIAAGAFDPQNAEAEKHFLNGNDDERERQSCPDEENIAKRATNEIHALRCAIMQLGRAVKPVNMKGTLATRTKQQRRKKPKDARATNQQTAADEQNEEMPANGAALLQEAAACNRRANSETGAAASSPIGDAAYADVNRLFAALLRRRTTIECWQFALANYATSLSQLYLFLGALERSVDWDKSIQNRICRTCNRLRAAVPARSGSKHAGPASATNNMRICDRCDLAFHIECLARMRTAGAADSDSLLEESADAEAEWLCYQCTAEQALRDAEAATRQSVSESQSHSSDAEPDNDNDNDNESQASENDADADRFDAGASDNEDWDASDREPDTVERDTLRPDAQLLISPVSTPRTNAARGGRKPPAAPKQTPRTNTVPPPPQPSTPGTPSASGIQTRTRTGRAIKPTNSAAASDFLYYGADMDEEPQGRKDKQPAGARKQKAPKYASTATTHMDVTPSAFADSDTLDSDTHESTPLGPSVPRPVASHPARSFEPEAAAQLLNETPSSIMSAPTALPPSGGLVMKLTAPRKSPPGEHATTPLTIVASTPPVAAAAPIASTRTSLGAATTGANRVRGRPSTSGGNSKVAGVRRKKADDDGYPSDDELRFIAESRRRKSDLSMLDSSERQIRLIGDLIKKELCKHEDAWPFLKPVTKKIAPDYFDVIRNPMDFQTIRARLDSLKYADPQALIADVRLVFDNCDLYNARGTPVQLCGYRLRLFFESRLVELQTQASF